MAGWIYENDFNNSVRYILGEEGSHTFYCFGINPSTAEPNSLDNTLRQVKARAYYFGYDSWVMFNIYPQRATDPANLHKKINLEIHEENKRFIENYCSRTKGKIDIWAAWGTLIQKRDFLLSCLKEIYSLLQDFSNWYSVGDLSLHGHPHHPLYLKKGLPLEVFDMERYLQEQLS